MRESGIIVMDIDANNIMLGIPNNKNVGSTKILNANLTSYGYYHVIDYMKVKKFTYITNGDSSIG
jgi:hypothetical protein